jgi:phosphoglycerol transferase MdoB-like AlkP superfamily enzyme
MKFLKKYFLIFIITYVVVVGTKIIFALYMHENFVQFNMLNIISAILQGYKFDFATSAFAALLGTFFDFNKKAFAGMSALFIVSFFLLQISDIFYYNESSRHIGYEITDVLTDAKSLFLTALSHYGVFSFIAFVMAVAMFYGLYRLFLHCQAEKLDKSYILKKIFLIALSIFFIRGMWQHIPLNPWQSNQIGEPQLAPLVVNGSYNAIFSLASHSKKLKMQQLPPVKEAIIKESFRELYNDDNHTVANLPIVKTKPNVVLFFLESWSAVNMKPYGFKYETTPNFDAILKKSIRPPVMIASGHRTTEGIFAVTASWQNPLGKSVAKTNLQNNHYDSIINIFNKLGYSSAFFQGTSKETSGTGSLAQQMGFHYSYGKRDVKKRLYEENYWGVHDVDLYNFTLKKLHTTLKEPFVIGINGATTHDNKIPKGIKKLTFTGTSLDTQLNALHFADYALGKFIKEMEKKYPNTIYVLFADHCGGVSGTLRTYEIPFAIYAPNFLKPKKLHTILSQRDIAPTLYDLTIGSYKAKELPFSGKSIFSDTHFFADYYHSGILGWIEDKNLVETNLENADYQCYKWENFRKEPRTCTQNDVKLRNHALSFTKVSQKLLFEDRIEDFKKYRWDKKD